jgi:Tfp pilus assembly protein PilF
MGVYQVMLGRELPCTVGELLAVRPLPLPGAEHERLIQSVDFGKAYPDQLCRLGLSHLGRQELGLAQSRLRDAVALKPDYIPARLALAAVCDLLAQHAQAADQIDAVLALDGSAAQSTVSRYALFCAAGFSLERLGTPGAAAFRYQQALAEEQCDLFAHHRLAAIYMTHNELDKSVEHHRAILDAEPQQTQVRVSLAHLLQLLGHHEQAVWEYEKALCLEPDSWDIQMELADQCERMGKKGAAINHLRRLVRDHPEFPDLHLRLANLHSTAGNDQAASAEFDEALRVHPDYLDGHIALARHELRMGRHDAAVQHFHRALMINNQNVEAYAGLAIALQHLGQTQQADETLASAAKIAGNSDVLMAQLGQLELSARSKDASGKDNSSTPQQAIATQLGWYETVLSEHPAWTDVRMRYGMILKLAGRHAEAARQFELVVKDNPAHVEAWLQLAMSRRAAGNDASAREALQQAIQIHPQQCELHYRLGLIYCSEMEFDLALERLQIAAELSGQAADFPRQFWAILQELQPTGLQRAAASAQPGERQRAA